MTANRETKYPAWLWIIATAAALTTIANSCNQSTTSSSSTNFTPSSKQEDFGYRYTKERVKLEGYSDKEASQAADAIMKFQRAQEQRRNGQR